MMDLYEICLLVIQFFLYSVLGWCMEVVLKYRQYHRFINRGFLIGPYCPIYGGGAVLLTVLIGGTVSSDAHYLTVFFMSVVICGVLEYFSGWFMEKCFHARWWDYSTKPLNLHGRIWIGNLILFGLGGVVIVKGINPGFFRKLSALHRETVYILAGVIVAVMLTDYVLSTIILSGIKNEIDGTEADNSEELSIKVRELLLSHSIWTRRISQAFPNLRVSPKYLIRVVKEKTDELADAVKEKTDEFTDAVKEKTDAMREKSDELADAVKGKKEELAGAMKEKKESVKEKVEKRNNFRQNM